MNIHEYQAKDILRGAGVPIPPGEVASSAEEAEAIAAKIGGMVVVKAQVHTGGRGKAAFWSGYQTKQSLRQRPFKQRMRGPTLCMR